MPRSKGISVLISNRDRLVAPSGGDHDHHSQEFHICILLQSLKMKGKKSMGISKKGIMYSGHQGKITSHLVARCPRRK